MPILAKTGVPESRLEALLHVDILQRFTPQPASFTRRLVSCTGKDFCHYSLIDTKGQALVVSQRLQELMPEATPMRLHWSGCPHACGLHYIGDIGFQAQRVRIGAEIVDAADVFVGGRLGSEPRLATKVMDSVPLSELPERLAAYLQSNEPARRPAEVMAK